MFGITSASSPCWPKTRNRKLDGVTRTCALRSVASTWRGAARKKLSARPPL